MWVIVLVPMWLRRHDEVEEVRSVDKFNSAMHTLRRDAGPVKNAAVPHRSRSVEVHVSGASADGQGKPRRSATERRAARPVVSAETRRRRTLIGLLVTTVLTLLLAVVVGGLMLWALQVIADLALAGFVMHLRNQAQRAQRANRASSRPAAARPQRVAPARRAAPARPDRLPMQRPAVEPDIAEVRRIRWDDAPAARAPQLEPLFDQTADLDQMPDDQTADFDQAAEFDQTAVFDQTARFSEPARFEEPAQFEESAELYETTELDRIVGYDAPAARAERPVRYRFDDVAFDDTSFDRRVFDRTDFDDVVEPAAATAATSATEAPIAEPVAAPAAQPVAERPAEPAEVAPRPPRRVARTMRSRTRETERIERVAGYDPVAKSEDEGGIGERPWEPVPVPRPVYATKPKAPKRRNRAPEMEPLLPPAETAAELDPIDDLEEILDRRWAVND
jgi:hypothetical protein